VEIDAQESKELTAVQTDYLQYIFQAINTLLTQNLGFFDTMGQNLFRSFATILIAWYGIKSALSAASGRSPFHFDNFASLLLTISFGFAMVNYYKRADSRRWHQLPQSRHQRSAIPVRTDRSSPTPNGDHASGGLRIPHGLSDVGRHSRNRHLRHRDHPARRGPGCGDCGHRLWVHCHCGLRSGGAGLCPVLYRPEDGVALLGWFRCFIQYAFYQVIAAAVVFIIGNLMLGALRLPPAGTLSTVQLIAWFPVLFITFLASIYALLKVPALTNHIFSGTAGGSSVGIIERVFE